MNDPNARRAPPHADRGRGLYAVEMGGRRAAARVNGSARVIPALVAMLAITTAAPAGHAQAGASPPLSGGATGDPISSSWTIRTLDGEPVAFESFRGGIVFLNAWASWCTPCVREMADIERLAARVADLDLEFVLVAVEREAAVRRHLRRYPTSLPVYLEHERFPAEFGLRGIPMTWILDRDGRIAYRWYGAAPWDSPEVEAFLRSLAAAPAP